MSANQNPIKSDKFFDCMEATIIYCVITHNARTLHGMTQTFILNINEGQLEHANDCHHVFRYVFFCSNSTLLNFQFSFSRAK